MKIMSLMVPEIIAANQTVTNFLEVRDA